MRTFLLVATLLAIHLPSSKGEVLPCNRVYDFGSDEQLKQFLLTSDNQLESVRVILTKSISIVLHPASGHELL
jgi:hypothetical protein